MPGRARRAGGATVLVIVSCTAVQGSAALSVPLFDVVQPAAAAAWRQVFGAIVLLSILRPRLRGRSRAEWATIGALGVAVATMNVTFYEAVDRLPLGIAATILYLGPFAVAAATTELGWRLALPAAVLTGVALVSRPGGDADPVGICLGLVAAGALAAYTVASHRLGRHGGLDGIALAVAVSAVLLAPFSVTGAGGLRHTDWLVLAVSGVVGVGLAFSCDFAALRLVGTRVVSTLFALDPVVGAVIGAVVLSQHLTVQTAVGIGVIVVAGAVTAASTPPHPSPTAGVEYATVAWSSGVMTLQGEYDPSPSEWVRNQVEQYEATGGAEANTLPDHPEWPIVVITSKGAKSGKLRKNPVMRVEKDGVYAAVASKGGTPEHPVWYHNFVAHPEVDLQDGPEPHTYTARVAEGAERAEWWERCVAQYSPYAEYQEKTDREIPVFLLERA